MQARKESSGYWLILGRGEEIISTISSWAKKEGIEGGTVVGIGGVSEAELGAYELKSSQYLRKKFSGEYELASFVGNINKEGVHAHAVISSHDYAAISGHMFSGKISLVGEFFVTKTESLEKAPLGVGLLRKIVLGK